MGKKPLGRAEPAGNFRVLKVPAPAGPFLFFNGNTFAEFGRALTNALLRDLPFHRRKEAASAVAHFITGVQDHDSMVQTGRELCETADFKPGERVKPLRGSMRERCERCWQMAGSSGALIAARN